MTVLPTSPHRVFLVECCESAERSSGKSSERESAGKAQRECWESSERVLGKLKESARRVLRESMATHQVMAPRHDTKESLVFAMLIPYGMSQVFSQEFIEFS